MVRIGAIIIPIAIIKNIDVIAVVKVVERLCTACYSVSLAKKSHESMEALIRGRSPLWLAK